MVSYPLTGSQLKLASVLLYKAGEKFSNHSCNDFDLVKDGGLTVTEAREIQELILSLAPKSEQDGIDLDSTHVEDWVLMHTLAKAFRP